MLRFCLLLIIAFCTVTAKADENDILVVHSYHQGLFWTDSFQYGFEQQIAPYNLSTRILYLDTKRSQSKQYLEQLYLLYKTKFEQEAFKAIVVSDNNALNLINKLSDQIGNTPVIFGGINHYEPYLHRYLNATGVIENVDIAANIALIERIQPDIDSIYLITDHSVTGEAARADIGAFLNANTDYEGKLVSYIPDNFTQLIDFISNLDQRAAVIFWLYNRTRTGDVISDSTLWEVLNQSSKAPIYMAHDYGLGYGAVGGVIQGGTQHGQQTAKVLLKVLNNLEAPLPPVEMGVSEIKLDYNAVQKWGLGVEGEPAAALFNRPQTFTEKYQRQLKAVGVTMILLVLVILGLVYYLRQIKRSEQLAKDSQTLIEVVFDQSYHFIGVLDGQGLLLSSNRKLHDLLYDQSFRIDRPIWQHPHWENNSAQDIERYFNQHHQGQNAQFEVEIWHAELGAIVLELSLKPIPSQKNGAQFLFEARDITSRKITEERLFQRETNLSHYYDQQPVMMVTLDEHNRIQQANQFAEQLLGYSSDEILGHRLREFYLHADALVPRQVLLQPKQAIKGVWRRDIEYRHADGQTVWIRENIRPLVETGHLLIVGEDVTETRALAQQLKYQAEHDLLTGSYSRNFFENALKQALEDVSDDTRTHAMLYIDLDQLKVLNDTAGHEAGDAAIQFCASMLEEVLPYNTILARMGGDEFAILLKDCTELDAKRLAGMIINTLSEHAFLWEDIRLNLTCSIGIRLIDHTAASPQMVHAQADTACHAAKEEGRNRFNMYCLDDIELRRREQEMKSVNLVHNALANQRIELFAQQILDLSDEQSGMHFEILIRIKSAEGEYISPGIFMPASERYNIAHLLDKQVISQTLAWFEQHPQALEKLSLCSINLSGHSMGNKEFIAYLLNTLEHSSVSCSKICLEITETAAMRNMDQAIAFFTQVKALGCQIALDDFGSGLSSFGYLKKLPVDIVKIDGIFVQEMDTNEVDHLMVRSINDLAHKMGKKTVAEFVENPAIIEQLIELDVDYAQGYYIGKPKPLAELVEQLSVRQKA